MKKVLLVFALFLCASMTSFAQQTESVDKGGTAMGFVAVNPDPASAAMGLTGFSSASSGAWASFGNMAGASMSGQKYSAAVSYLSWVPDEQSGIYAGTSVKLGRKIVCSLGFGRQAGEPYEEFNASGGSMGEFSPNDMRINAGLSCRIAESISAGAVLHYLSSSIATDATMNAVCADVSAVWARFPFSAAVGVRNIGTPVKDSRGNSFHLPQCATLAGGYELPFGEDSAVHANLDADYYLSEGVTVGVGAEYAFRDMLFARAGARLGNDVIPTFASVGAGLRIAGISLNATYLLASDTIGGSFLAGLSYAF